MRKVIVLFTILSLLATLGVAVLVGFAPAGAGDGSVTRVFDNPAQGYTDYVKPLEYWDLTRGDLTISYELDMSGYTPAHGQSEVSEVGAVDRYGGGGRLQSSADDPDQYVDDFDRNDLLVLQNSKPGDNRYTTYDALRRGDSYSTWQPGLAPWAWWSSCGIWFDRGPAEKKPHAALYDGRMCNTGGKYEVSVTYHAFDANNGAMFATVNGIPTGFYAPWPEQVEFVGEPRYVQAGKTITGDMTALQVFARRMGQNVSITDLTATGFRAAPALTFVTPSFAQQGDKLKGVNLLGDNFRPVPATVQLKPDAGSAINSISTNYLDRTWMQADINIPETAVAGKYDTEFWHNDDTANVACLPDSFDIYNAPPQITSTNNAHCRPGKTVTVTVSGKFFRNTAMTVKLVRGNETIIGRNVRWISATCIKADFTIPSGATVACDWDVYVSHNDDGKVAALASGFSVDARMDIINPFGLFNIIWLRAPGILKVVLYSEPGFDALGIFPLAVDLGGAFPIAANPQDVNRDGRKDQVFYFWNMSVNLPVGYNKVVRMLCADLTFKRVQAFDTVKVFRFLF